MSLWENGSQMTWTSQPVPAGYIGASRWGDEITTLHLSELFGVYERLVKTEWGEVRHLIVFRKDARRPSWWEMQQIKDALAGPQATAVEVYPPADEVVDEGEVFHLWVLPMPLPFSLHRDNGPPDPTTDPERERRRAECRALAAQQTRLAD